jgi:hypothetical protein
VEVAELTTKALHSFETAMDSCEATRETIENYLIGEECLSYMFGDGTFEALLAKIDRYRVENRGTRPLMARHNGTREAS